MSSMRHSNQAGTHEHGHEIGQHSARDFGARLVLGLALGLCTAVLLPAEYYGFSALQTVPLDGASRLALGGFIGGLAPSLAIGSCVERERSNARELVGPILLICLLGCTGAVASAIGLDYLWSAIARTPRVIPVTWWFALVIAAPFAIVTGALLSLGMVPLTVALTRRLGGG